MDLRKKYKDSWGMAWTMLNPTWAIVDWAKKNNQRVQDKRQSPTMNNYKSNLNLTTYNERYPWFDEEDYKKLEQWAISRWLTGEQKTQFMDEAYQYYYPQVLNQKWLDERAKEINQTASENGSAILNWDKTASRNMRLVDLAQTAKRVKWIAYDCPDEDVINAIQTNIPDGQQLLLNYLNNGDDTILYKAGLKKTDAQLKTEEYNNVKENINKALTQNWKQLSQDGLKYLRDYNVMFQTVDEARLQGLWQWLSDDELLLNLIYISPELQEIEKEIGTLNLDHWDKSILWITDDSKWAVRDDRHEWVNMIRDWLWWNSSTPATLNDIEQAIYVKENGGLKEDWKNFKANLRNWGDTMEKIMNRAPKDFENFMNQYLPTKNILEMELWKELTDEEYNQIVEERRLDNIRQVQEFDASLNREIQSAREKIGLDPVIEDYYSKQWIIESLMNGDWWAWYKMAWETAWNWDMVLWVLWSAVNPVLWLTLMWTDTFARENQESFDSLIDAQMKQWVSYEDAYDNASKWAVVVWLVNTAIELWLEKFLWWVETTAWKNIKQTITRNLNKEVNDMLVKRWILEMLADWLTTQARSSLEEWLEEVFQQLTHNIAISGYDPDHKISDGLWEAFESWALNPMNLIAWWSELLSTQTLSDGDRQTFVDWANNQWIAQWQVVWAFNPKSIVNSIKYWVYSVAPTFSNIQNTENQILNQANTTTEIQNTETVDNWQEKATIIEDLYSIDPTLKKNLQNNPYTAEVWQRTKNYIDQNGRPERSNDVAKALIVDVADRVQEKLMEKLDEWMEAWKLYAPLKNSSYSVDLSELKNDIDSILEEYWIKIEEYEWKDWKIKYDLNFDKTAIDGSEAANIRKIYNWIKDTTTEMWIKEYKDRFRASMQEMVDFNPKSRDQAWRKIADTQGDKVIKAIMKWANDLAHNQIPLLAELDKVYSEWVKTMDEVSDWLVYKDKSKKWVIRDNITQIIKNLDEPSRRQLANRLETIMPWIKDEVNAINQMPKVIDHYYNPSKLQVTIRDKAWWWIGSIFWPLGWFIWSKVWEWTSEKIDEKKIKAWDKVLSETSEEWKAKLAEIESRIENNKKLTKAQQDVINDISERLKDESERMDNTIVNTTTDNTTTNIEEDIDAWDLWALPLDAIPDRNVWTNPTDTVISENVNEIAWNQAQELYNQGDKNLSPNSEQMTEVRSYTAEELWLPPVSATMLKNLDRSKYIPVEDPKTKKVVFYKVEELEQIPIYDSKWNKVNFDRTYTSEELWLDKDDKTSAYFEAIANSNRHDIGKDINKLQIWQAIRYENQYWYGYGWRILKWKNWIVVEYDWIDWVDKVKQADIKEWIDNHKILWYIVIDDTNNNKTYADNSYKPSITMKIDMNKEIIKTIKDMNIWDKLGFVDKFNRKWVLERTNEWYEYHFLNDPEEWSSPFPTVLSDMDIIWFTEPYYWAADPDYSDILSPKETKQEKSTTKNASIDELIDEVWHDIWDEWDWDWYKKMKKKDVIDELEDYVMDRMGEAEKSYWANYWIWWSEVQKKIKKFVNDRFSNEKKTQEAIKNPKPFTMSNDELMAFSRSMRYKK